MAAGDEETSSPSSAPRPEAGAQAGPMLGLVADGVPAMMAYFDGREQRYRFANRGFAAFVGRCADDIVGQRLRNVLNPELQAAVQPYVDAVLQGHSVRYVREWPQSDGSVHYYEVQMLPHTDAHGAVAGGFVPINDITQHRAAELEARDAAERLRKFEEATEEGIAFHHDTRITDVNDALLRLTGYTRAEMLGHSPTLFVAPSSLALVRENFATEHDAPYEAVLLTRDGHEVSVEVVAKTLETQGDRARLVVVRDITARKEAQRRIEFLAHHDTLTQLPNRALMHERLLQILSLARRQRREAAVMFIDLDNFKTINDSLGHHAGDVLLCEVARRISRTLRESDVVARMGGDEFVVVLAEVDSEAGAALVARRLLLAICEPVDLDGRAIATTPSIGVGMYPLHSENADELLRYADVAMYHAKDRGRCDVQFFNQSLLQQP